MNSIQKMKRVKNGTRLTQKHIDQLTAANVQTGCGAAAFLSWAEDVPKGLNSMTINHWMKGRVNKANAEYLAFVLEQWPKMPSKVVITDEMIERLKAEQDRTGVGPKRILATMHEVPDGLKPITISRWMTKRANTAKQDHIDAVLEAYAKINSDR